MTTQQTTWTIVDTQLMLISGCDYIYVLHCMGGIGYHDWRYELFPQRDISFSQDARPTILVDPLRLNFWVELRECCDCFYLWRVRIPSIWMFALYCQLDYTRCKTKICWHSIDTDFHDGAGSLSLLFSHLKVAITLFTDICNQLLVRLRNMRHQK
jgi:hypothetical protein